MNLGPDGSVRLTVLGEHVAWLREHAETILWASRDRKARHIFNYAAMRLEVLERRYKLTAPRARGHAWRHGVACTCGG